MKWKCFLAAAAAAAYTDNSAYCRISFLEWLPFLQTDLKKSMYLVVLLVVTHVKKQDMF